MCGIFGIASLHGVQTRILNGLKELEYRGYDSAGIATIENNVSHLRKEIGKLDVLASALKDHPLPGTIGIGHIRWATHGSVTVENAHPHSGRQLALIHNGIIENASHYRALLAAEGIHCRGQTDSEVALHLFEYWMDRGLSMKDCILQALQELHGSFAFAILDRLDPDRLYFVRHGSPLVLGKAKDGWMVASDSSALVADAESLSYLEDGDWGWVTAEDLTLYHHSHPVARAAVRPETVPSRQTKAGWKHYMLKEIHEQPDSLNETISALWNSDTLSLTFDSLAHVPAPKQIVILGCGTSYYAGLLASYWYEHYAHIPTRVEIASEFRYRTPVIGSDHLVIALSQSGETADTLGAAIVAKECGARVVAIVNVPSSSLARMADHVILTPAGQEKGVAATKTFTSQLAVLGLLMVFLSRLLGALPASQAYTLLGLLVCAPNRMREYLVHTQSLRTLATSLINASSILYMGRGPSYVMACEGALKMKELSYIHAEATPAGELKHGPIALIDASMPIIALVPSDHMVEKTLSNIQEVISRGGKVIAIGDCRSLESIRDGCWQVIELPLADPFVTPYIQAIALQLLAYHVADVQGHDVDHPRNLAKSVTVE